MRIFFFQNSVDSIFLEKKKEKREIYFRILADSVFWKEKRKNFTKPNKWFVGSLKGNPSTKVRERVLNLRSRIQMVNALQLGYMLCYDIPYKEYMIRREAF